MTVSSPCNYIMLFVFGNKNTKFNVEVVVKSGFSHHEILIVKCMKPYIQRAMTAEDGFRITVSDK